MGLGKTERGFNSMKLVPRSHSAKHLSFILTKLQLIQAIEKRNKRIREKVVLSDRKDRARCWPPSREALWQTSSP